MIAFRPPTDFSMWIVIGTCLAWAGCGGVSGGPRTIPISGKITYKGEPVQNAHQRIAKARKAIPLDGLPSQPGR